MAFLPIVVNSASQIGSTDSTVARVMAASQIETYYGDFLFSIDEENKTATVKRNSSRSQVVTIPNSIAYNGEIYNVVAIGSGAFYEESSGHHVTSVEIPSSITSIGERAFKGCTSLYSIVIPNSVTSIGESAFYGCRSLKDVKLSNNIKTINKYTFCECENLESITIPNSVISIEEFAFYKAHLSSIVIPGSVVSIGRHAFDYCYLKSIFISHGVSNIESWAFQGWSLETLSIPSSITYIGENAFQECDNLKDVYCYWEKIPSSVNRPFNSLSNFDNTTLHVPASGIDEYKAKYPWRTFGKIVAIEDKDGVRCAKPTISYSKGKLSFNSSTEGAICEATITNSDISSFTGNEIQLSATYYISVYATKSGYENSDVATATLCWIEQQPQTEGITNGVTQVSARAVMISNNGGTLTIDGAEDGTPIAAYATTGHQAGSAVSANGRATIATTLQPGSIAIVKIGQKSVKVVVK